MMNMSDKSLSGNIDRLEGEVAILRLSDGQELHWPVERLPAGATEGAAIRLFMLTDVDQTKSQKELAQEILNEIFLVEEPEASK